MDNAHKLLVAAGTLAALTACTGTWAAGDTASSAEPMSFDDAKAALDEVMVSGEPEAYVAEPIELTTSFTIGQGVQAAADELQAWIESQLPCSEVTLDGATITMDLGDLADACTYKGNTYAGLIDLTVADASVDHVQVEHGWHALTDGSRTVEGGATVTWDDADTLSRRIEHAVTWVHDGRTVDVTGDRTQRLLDPDAGLAGGLGIDGVRDWTSETGDWHLDIDGVELLFTDPVPYTGKYVATNPAGQQLTMSFERLDADTIVVYLEGTIIPLELHVTSTGMVY